MNRFAIAALMACVLGVGTASAVSINWTGADGVKTTMNQDYNSSFTVSPSSTFSMLVTLNVSGYAGNQNWDVLKANNAAGTDGFRLRIEKQWMLLKYKNDGGTEKDASNGTNGNLSSTLNSTNGTLRVALVVTETGIRIAVTGQEALFTTGTIALDELTNWSIGTHVAGVDLAQVDVYAGTAWSDGQLRAAADGQLPEPTALALLALGVAGVALRRRVA